MRVIGRTVCGGVVAAGMLVAAIGCGGGGGTSGGAQTLDDVLRGLQSAAKSKATFDAIRHSDDLAKTEKAVINAFCSVTTQLADNQETYTEQQYFDSITGEIRTELGYLSSPALTALGKLRATYDLATISPPVARYYAQACYR